MKKNNVGCFLLSIVGVAVIVALFYTCNRPSKEDIQKEKEEIHEKITDSLWSIEAIKIKSFIQESNGDTAWATHNLYTYQYQDRYINKSRLICFMGKVIDVYMEDSTYFIKVLYKKTNGTQDFIELKNKGNYYFNDLSGDYGLFISKIRIDRQTALQIIDKINTKRWKDIGYFIFKVTRIKSMNPFTNMDEDGETHQVSDNFNTDFSNFIFEGDIVNYYLLNSYEDTPKN
jgi:hypothetical protein